MPFVAEKIIIALDHEDFDGAKKFIELMGSSLKFVKVGSVLFSSCGPKILDYVASKNLKIFLDLKFHDIPNTVANSIRRVLKHAPIELLTIHSSGGAEMISMAKESISMTKQKTKLLAVTALTSLDEQNLKNIGYQGDPAEIVMRLAKLAHMSGADGVVCSPNELIMVRKNFSKEFIIVTPGIRPSMDATTSEKKVDDQKRIATPKFAFENGANFIVMGRPITQSDHPVEFLKIF